MNKHSEVIEFRVNCAKPLVYLVGRTQDGTPLFVKMQKSNQRDWFARLELSKGVYRFRYYGSDGRNVTYFGPAHAASSTEDGWDALVSIEEPSANAVSQDNGGRHRINCHRHICPTFATRRTHTNRRIRHATDNE